MITDQFNMRSASMKDRVGGNMLSVFKGDVDMSYKVIFQAFHK